MARRGESVTLAHEVYERLRAEVLSGGLQPGQRLQPGELRQRYQVSVGVMREALTRLAENHLVVVVPNQGFRVVRMTAEEIADLTRIRTTIEGLALRMAIERGDLAWRSEILAAHFRLTRTPRSSAEQPTVPTEEWTGAHETFHRTLVTACRVPTLLTMCGALADAMTLYRNSTPELPPGRGQEAAAEHQAIVDALLADNTDLALAHLKAHFENTAKQFLSVAVPSSPADSTTAAALP